MSGTENETLTAALRRLADEHASGLLSIAAPGRDVVLELAAGVPVAIGPVHDVTERVGSDAPAAVRTAAVVDDLVDSTVAAVVGGGGDWTWDVTSDAERLPVPRGLVEELARRAVDGAKALAATAPDDVLLPAHDVVTTGEVDRLRALFDGERSLQDVAEAAGRTVPATATVAAALVDAGALATDDEDGEDGAGQSWIDAVAAAADDDEDDDEPELWVMEPPEDEDEPEPPVDEVVAQEVARLEDPAGPDEAVAPAAAAPADEDEEFDDFFTPVHDTPERAAPPAADADRPAAATGTPGWNDTAWLDELHDPLDSRGGDDVRDGREALTSMLGDLQGAPPAQAAPAPDPDPDHDEDEGEEPGEPAARKEPRAEPGDVAEFLRELSRLALDDD